MSFEEPKAPIVRIKKKKIKKKSKEKDVVQLPVRASQSTRYSSLTSDPQGKSRECCRHVAQTCFRIPVCRFICFRCILPPCYGGEGSDDEKEEDIREEEEPSNGIRGSVNGPRSSQHGQAHSAMGGTTTPAGAVGGASSIEMVEMTETVVLIPPPRLGNEYGKDPCSSRTSTSSKDEEKGPKSEIAKKQPTYVDLNDEKETLKAKRLSDEKTVVGSMNAGRSCAVVDQSAPVPPGRCVTSEADGYEEPMVKDSSWSEKETCRRTETEMCVQSRAPVSSSFVDVPEKGSANGVLGATRDERQGDSQTNSSDYVNMDVLVIDEQSLGNSESETPTTYESEGGKTGVSAVSNLSYMKVSVLNCQPSAEQAESQSNESHNYLNVSDLGAGQTTLAAKDDSEVVAPVPCSGVAENTVEEPHLYVNIDSLAEAPPPGGDVPIQEKITESETSPAPEIEKELADDECDKGPVMETGKLEITVEENGINDVISDVNNDEPTVLSTDSSPDGDNDKTKLIKKKKADADISDTTDESSIDNLDRDQEEATDQTRLL